MTIIRRCCIRQNQYYAVVVAMLSLVYYRNYFIVTTTISAWRPSTSLNPLVNSYRSQYRQHQVKMAQQQQQRLATRIWHQHGMFEDAVVSRKMNVNDDNDVVYHDIVLFSIGDLRIDDHGGITNAIQFQQQLLKAQKSGTGNNPTIHCCVVLTDSILQNICGIVAHTSDTINCIVSSIHELNDAIISYSKTNETISVGPLHCFTSTTTTTETTDDKSIMHYIDEYIHSNLNIDVNSNSNSKILLHVCDLGPVDNEMGYNVYGQILKQQQCSMNTSFHNQHYEIVPWKNVLRTEPWDHVSNIVTNFPM